MDNFCFGDQGANAHSVTSRKSLIRKGLYIEVRIMPIMLSRPLGGQAARKSLIPLEIDPPSPCRLRAARAAGPADPPRRVAPGGRVRLRNPTRAA